MTCEEYRWLCTTRRPSDVSRAERAAIIRHGWTCEACCGWLSAASRAEPPLMAEAVAENEVMLVGDCVDPEFIDVLTEDPS